MEKWFCPAVKKEIDQGLCWEYFFSDRGGPTDTASELREWIKLTKIFRDINHFQKICENCEHKQG